MPSLYGMALHALQRFSQYRLANEPAADFLKQRLTWLLLLASYENHHRRAQHPGASRWLLPLAILSVPVALPHLLRLKSMI